MLSFDRSSEINTECRFEISTVVCLQQSSIVLCDYMAMTLVLIFDYLVKWNVFRYIIYDIHYCTYAQTYT